VALIAAPAVAQTPVIPIALKSFSYTPSMIHLRAGQEVTLTHQSIRWRPQLHCEGVLPSGQDRFRNAPEGEVELARDSRQA
jgi:hypothetical protein